MFTVYMTSTAATTATANIETLVVPMGGEFEVVTIVNGTQIHIAWSMDRKSAEAIAAGIGAR